jgi:hypothetical protein
MSRHASSDEVRCMRPRRGVAAASQRVITLGGHNQDCCDVIRTGPLGRGSIVRANVSSSGTRFGAVPGSRSSAPSGSSTAFTTGTSSSSRTRRPAPSCPRNSFAGPACHQAQTLDDREALRVSAGQGALVRSLPARVREAFLWLSHDDHRPDRAVLRLVQEILSWPRQKKCAEICQVY